jgi:hypothetical protein
MSAVLRDKRAEDERSAELDRAIEKFAEWARTEVQLPPTLPASCHYALAQYRAQQAATPPRFSRTFCSSCGREFGPGNHGFSHCENHAHLRGRF